MLRWLLVCWQKRREPLSVSDWKLYAPVQTQYIQSKIQRSLSRKDFVKTINHRTVRDADYHCEVLLNIRPELSVYMFFNLQLNLQQFHKLRDILLVPYRWLPWDLRVVEWLSSSLLLPLFVSNEARNSSSWQPTQGALVGRHPLMAADEWGASRATGVKVGRMQGLSRWGLIWPLPPPPLQTSFSAHNGIGQQPTLHLLSHQMKMRGVWYIKSIPDCQGTQKEIHHWHLEFVWWPEIERLDLRCLRLNCTAGVKQTREGKHHINWWISIGE